ncbi:MULTISPECIES: hypothetical protein [unclassified Marinobacter]|jgi:hypothetical protein|uniref:hypothetical protein n=1 Tax=unclassified Marinobacter TaxID=83889 RepID=UPI00200E683C|nr:MULTISPECIES: hypothetical protein [unclassified Marinobacter]MCL1476764.1 hypothetical protein [Marinobacter sp.]MCL1488075.1 hypothetical protein [Marinobacter sp.]UQG57290.1 hypothetical protein MIH16_06510 [Marinobacter sp. M4C]UQG66094.1 hypothetical protein MIH17_06510 [Marinobacter sp. M2C]UQG70374.1 hypothetical protein MIH19_06505 [Marinobacter sp. M1C]
MDNSEQAKYPALRIIAAWYKVFGYLVGGILVIYGVILSFGDGSTSVGIGVLLGGLAFVVISVATAEIIQVFLDTETHTRNSADLLGQLVDLNKKNARPAPAPAEIMKRPMPARKANEAQAQSIKNLIHHLHKDGLSDDEIVRELKAENMPTLDGATSWNASAVTQVLSPN